MPLIELPNGQSAVIRSRAEVSERTVRAISRAFMRAAGTAAKLQAQGFDETKPETWTTFSQISDEDQDNLDGYQAALICGMVSSWTLGDLPDEDNVLDLPKATFDALANACGAEFNQVQEFGPDGAIDPKAPSAD
jgi:hypothetical protein